jgi:hypothetical protein
MEYLQQAPEPAVRLRAALQSRHERKTPAKPELHGRFWLRGQDLNL